MWRQLNLNIDSIKIFDSIINQSLTFLIYLADIIDAKIDILKSPRIKIFYHIFLTGIANSFFFYMNIVAMLFDA